MSCRSVTDTDSADPKPAASNSQLQGILNKIKVQGHGGFADVWVGEWIPPGAKAPTKVAIKYLRAVRVNLAEERQATRIMLRVSKTKDLSCALLFSDRISRLASSATVS